MREKSIKVYEDVEVTHLEYAAQLEEYDVMLGTFYDYANMIVQYGYATMFIAAFPLATGMSLINSYFALRTCAWKLCQVYKRPNPRSCEDIGNWYVILEGINFIAVITNSALVAFTGSQISQQTWTYRLGIFIVMVFGILGVKSLINLAIADIPVEVDIQLQRQAFIISKIIHNSPDDNYESSVPGAKGAGVSADYRVRSTDDDPF